MSSSNTSHALPSATFRDPAGSLSFEADRVVRTIHPDSRSSVLEFLESPFCVRAQLRGDLIAATIEDTPDGLRLIHPRVAIPTYPWEWTPSQWLVAAQLTLDLADEALGDGYILKDATPLNVLFQGSRPIFVDILSFDVRDPHESIWLAYGQYMRTFLLPLIMHQEMSWPLALSLFKRDGYEPAELYKAMGWGQRLSRAAFWPITLPAWLESKKKSEKTEGAPANTSSKKSDPDLAVHILKRSLADLRRRTARALSSDGKSEWSHYLTNLTHYTPEQTAQKRDWVRLVLEEFHPAYVMDIGANTGEYSALAAESGAQVIALERDGPAAERLYCMSRARELALQTIHADFSRPTPAAGWENRESSALLPRLEGRCDLVMLLAVIHHLILMEQIPVPAILALCHRLTRRLLIIEWVPVTDPMFQSLMRGRDNLYGSLSVNDLLSASAGLFTVLRQQPLENGRILFLFEKQPG